MHILNRPVTEIGRSREFTGGDVYIDEIPAPHCSHHRLEVTLVRYAPGARTAWHMHPHGQTLHVTRGVGHIQARGSHIIQVRPGNTVFIPLKQWHWHGAAPDDYFEHLSITGNDTDGQPPVAWGGHVADEETSLNLAVR